jgi:hypothetical protein
LKDGTFSYDEIAYFEFSISFYGKLFEIKVPYVSGKEFINSKWLFNRLQDQVKDKKFVKENCFLFDQNDKVIQNLNHRYSRKKLNLYKQPFKIYLLEHFDY